MCCFVDLSRDVCMRVSATYRASSAGRRRRRRGGEATVEKKHTSDADRRAARDERGRRAGRRRGWPAEHGTCRAGPGRRLLGPPGRPPPCGPANLCARPAVAAASYRRFFDERERERAVCCRDEATERASDRALHVLAASS